MNEEYQSVWITFSDGSRHGFTGKAAVWPGGEVGLTVVDVKFTEPKPLPDGCSFEDISAGGGLPVSSDASSMAGAAGTNLELPI